MSEILTSSNGYQPKKVDKKGDKVKKTMRAMAASLEKANSEGYISALDAIIAALQSDTTPDEYTSEQIVDLIGVIKANITTEVLN